jgi:hypothetical protein
LLTRSFSYSALRTYMHIPTKKLLTHSFGHDVLCCTKNGVVRETLFVQYSRPHQNGVNLSCLLLQPIHQVTEIRVPRWQSDTRPDCLTITDYQSISERKEK